MNIDQLMESLSDNAPDAGDVLASFGRKRRTARNRMYAASGGLAVAVVVVALGALLHGSGTTASTAESAPAAGVAVPAATPAAGAGQNGHAALPNDGSRSAASRAASCGVVQLDATLAQAVRDGASVIVGYGTLTSGSAAVPGAASDAPTYYSLTLRSVRTLAGPTVTSGSIAWIASPGAGSGAATAQPRAFPASGELFGVVSPPAGSGVPGPVLQAAPVASGQVLLRGGGCWDTAAPALTPPQPASTFGPTDTTPPGADVITKVPLATAEKLAAQSG